MDEFDGEKIRCYTVSTLRKARTKKQEENQMENTTVIINLPELVEKMKFRKAIMALGIPAFRYSKYTER